MKAVLKRELLLNIKSMLIWSLSVGILGLTCILLYSSMEGEMKDMADYLKMDFEAYFGDLGIDFNTGYQASF